MSTKLCMFWSPVLPVWIHMDKDTFLKPTGAPGELFTTYMLFHLQSIPRQIWIICYQAETYLWKKKNPCKSIHNFLSSRANTQTEPIAWPPRQRSSKVQCGEAAFTLHLRLHVFIVSAQVVGRQKMKTHRVRALRPWSTWPEEPKYL